MSYHRTRQPFLCKDRLFEPLLKRFHGGKAPKIGPEAIEEHGQGEEGRQEDLRIGGVFRGSRHEHVEAVHGYEDHRIPQQEGWEDGLKL